MQKKWIGNIIIGTSGYTMNGHRYIEGVSLSSFMTIETTIQLMRKAVVELSAPHSKPLVVIEPNAMTIVISVYKEESISTIDYYGISSFVSDSDTCLIIESVLALLADSNNNLKFEQLE